MPSLFEPLDSYFDYFEPHLFDSERHLKSIFKPDSPQTDFPTIEQIESLCMHHVETAQEEECKSYQLAPHTRFEATKRLDKGAQAYIYLAKKDD